MPALLTDADRARYQQATAVFKLALKASSKAIHRTLNRAPSGKGWVQCARDSFMRMKEDRAAGKHRRVTGDTRTP